MLRSLGLEVVKIREVHPLIQIVVIIIALLVAFALSGIFIAFSGADPIEAFMVMFKGAFGGRRQVLETLLRSTPLLLTGLATVITFHLISMIGIFVDLEHAICTFGTCLIPLVDLNDPVQLSHFQRSPYLGYQGW